MSDLLEGDMRLRCCTAVWVDSKTCEVVLLAAFWRIERTGSVFLLRRLNGSRVESALCGTHGCN
jgi:hypothetical protein